MVRQPEGTPVRKNRQAAEPVWKRRTVLAHAGRATAAAILVGPSLIAEGCSRVLVPASNRPEPPLVHYRMPYASVALRPGPALTRAYDEAALLCALQGIVNRDAPRLYVLGLSGPGVADLDGFWWARCVDLGWEVARQAPYQAKDLPDLLSIYGHRTGGLVVWDPEVPATQNVAATLAGAQGLLPVARRTAAQGAPASLYHDLTAAGWRAAVWLVHPDGAPIFTGHGKIPGTDLPSTGSAKNDAYLWAKVHYLDAGRCSPQHLAYYIDAAWLTNPGAGGSFWNNTLVNHDYYVAQRAFFFDLDPWEDEAPVDDPHQRPGTDAATLRAILRSTNEQTGGDKMINAGGFPPWAFKYTDHPGAGGRHGGVPTEWHYAELLSAWNAFMEADALGYAAIANASFTQHFPLQARYAQPAPPDRAALTSAGLLSADGTVAPGRYFAFYVGDFDSPAWLYQVGPSLWNDPDRGKVPLSWAFNPNLCLRAAPAMAWTRATASPADTFVAGDSGAGYLNPGALEAPRPSGLPSGVQAWADHCSRFYHQWDLTVTGFIIEGDAAGMQAAGLMAYSAFSPGGIVGQKLPPRGLIDGMPVLTMGTDLDGTPEVAAAAVRGLFLPLAGPQFGVARAILQKPSWYRAVAEGIAIGEGATSAPIRVLDVPTLLALVAEWQRHGNPGGGGGSADAVTLSATASGLQAAGLRPVSAADGKWQVGQAGGRAAVAFTDNPYNKGGVSYLYLSVDRGGAFPAGQAETLWLQVRYFDAPAGLTLSCDYDSTGAYTPTLTVTTTGTQAWKTVTWELRGADLRGAQNGGADLRLDGLPGLAVDLITLSRRTPG